MMEIACHAMEQCFPLFTIMTVLSYLLFIGKMNCIINQRIEHPFHSPQNVRHTREKFQLRQSRGIYQVGETLSSSLITLRSVIAIYSITQTLLDYMYTT